ncbi:hypothetical protein Tco_0422306 [Tanacetum coccineum]
MDIQRCNALREQCVVNQDPGVKFSQDPPQIDHNCCYECGDSLDAIFCQQCICKFCGKGAHLRVIIVHKSSDYPFNPEHCIQIINELPQILPNENSISFIILNSFFNVSPSVLTHPPQPKFETYLCELCGNNAHYGYDCSPQFPFSLEGINMRSMNVNSKGIEKKRIAEEQTAKENRSFEEMRHEEQLVDYKIKEIINDLGYKRFRGEKIDKEYERDCEIRIRKLKQDFNEMGAAKFEKRSKLTKEEKYSVAVDYMLSITSDDEDDYIPSEILLARYSTPKSIHTWTLRSRNRRTLAHNGG